MFFCIRRVKPAAGECRRERPPNARSCTTGRFRPIEGLAHIVPARAGGHGDRAGAPRWPAATTARGPWRGRGTNTLFYTFDERSPRYLDPTASYSNDETPYTYQIYEPLYGYHYLKRPYELDPEGAPRRSCKPRYLDKDGSALPDDAPAEQIAESVYDIRIKPGIMYAPHPAFAKDAKGEYVYHHMKREDVGDKPRPADFKQTGTRELVADDYVYAIKRHATTAHQVAVVRDMSEYIVGLKEYGEKISRGRQAAAQGPGPTDPRQARSSISASGRSRAPRRSTGTRCASASKASIRS